MSSALGGSVSMSPGSSIDWEVFWTSPGYNGTIYWVPAPQQVGQFGFGSQYVSEDGNGDYHFGQTVSNDSGVTISFQVQYSSI